jgi:O-antigen/teichoic acid export membrane protein/DNA-directed RNA polymerase specialized sigma24 family protein
LSAAGEDANGFAKVDRAAADRSAERDVALNRLAGLASRGDRAALGRLLEAIGPMVVQYCRARIGTGTLGSQSAEDVAQETLLALCGALERWQPERRVMSFVYGIASNKIVDASAAAGGDRSVPTDTVPEGVEVQDGPKQTAVRGESDDDDIRATVSEAVGHARLVYRRSRHRPGALGMEDRAARGVVWTLLSYGGSKAISLLSMLVLAQLLVPADFGLVALAMLMIGFACLFRDLGLGATLILRQDLDRAALGTLFSLMLAMFAGVGVVVAATSPVVAFLFDEPRLTWVLAAMSVSMVLNAVGWFYDCVQQRELEFRARFFSLLVLALVTWGVSVLLAALGAGVWSLVVGQICGAAAYSCVQLARAPYRVRPSFDSAVARNAFSTSKGFLLQGVLTFVQENAAFFAVGRILNATQVGYFSMSYRLAELPYMAVADPLAKVTFPGFARMQHRREDITTAFLGALRIVALVATPIGLLLSACAAPFTRAVLGDEWVPMTSLLVLMGLWAAIRPVQGTYAWLLNSIGHANLLATLTLWILVPLVPGLLIAAKVGGLEGVAWVVLGDVVLSLMVFAFFVARRARITLTRQWRALRPVMLASPPCWASGSLTTQLAGSLDQVLTLGLGVLAGMLVYLAVLALSERGLIADVLAQANRVIDRGRSGTPS